MTTEARKRARSGSEGEDVGSSGPRDKAPKASEASTPAAASAAPAAPNAATLAAMKASVAARLAAASQKLMVPAAAPASVPVQEKAATAVHVLRLDSQGREVDEHGHAITRVANRPVLSSAANQRAAKLAANPYLAHRGSGSGGAGSAAKGARAGSGSSSSVSQKDKELEEAVVDERIVSAPSRATHAKKALTFHAPGALVEQAARAKEEARLRRGVGRHHPEVFEEEGEGADAKLLNAALRGTDTESMKTAGAGADADATATATVPSKTSQVGVPTIEWWDLPFLPADYRKSLGLKMNLPTHVDVDAKKLQLKNCKTHNLIQHPPAVSSLKADALKAPLPMHLTKKERKKLRTQKRMSAEQERRDKQMMGLIPAPEPKFKLSNFMRILGDQAIADPSVVEQKVIEQMRQRELKHEMDNLSRKLTPAQRYEKKVRKLTAATVKAREMHVAVFSVKDLDAPRLRYKIDVNASSWLLTGTAVICNEGNINLVYVEGGPRAIKRFTRLMTHRLELGHVLTPAERYAVQTRDGSEGRGMPVVAVDSSLQSDAALSLAKGGSNEGGVDDLNSEEEEDDDDDDMDQETMGGEGETGDGTYHSSGIPNECHHLWSGVSSKRIFTDFRFRECKTQGGAKKLLEGHFLHAYWSLAVQSLQ